MSALVWWYNSVMPEIKINYEFKKILQRKVAII